MASQTVAVPAREVRAMFLIRQTTLEYLLREKFVVAAVDAGAGPGTERLYSLVNLFEIGVITALRNSGFTYLDAGRQMRWARRFMGVYRHHLADPVTRALLGEEGYNPFEKHTVPSVTFLLSFLRRGSSRWLAFHLVHKEKVYGSDAPYGALVREGEEERLELKTDTKVAEYLRSSDTVFQVNLTRLSQKLEHYVQGRTEGILPLSYEEEEEQKEPIQ